MDIEEQKNRQEFFNDISNYQYFRDDGVLLLEPFGVYLSHCFGFDDILNKSPQPRDVYLLLLEIIKYKLGDADLNRYVQVQKIMDWRSGMEYMGFEAQWYENVR